MTSECGESISPRGQGGKDGDVNAVERLWRLYHARLIQWADIQLRKKNIPLAASDADDVVASAFRSLWRGAQRGQFSDVKDLDDLRAILFVITYRKLVDLMNRKRFSEYLGDRAELIPDTHTKWDPGERLEFDWLLDLLPSDLSEIVLLKLAHYTNKEIARIQNCAPVTVSRRLGKIRRILREKGGEL